MIGAAALASVVPGRPAPAAENTLYERIASGPLVVHGRCQAVGQRASVVVLEVLKGAYSGSSLQVAFRAQNTDRAPGAPKIEFVLGGESLLVLETEKDSRGRDRGSDRFILSGGYQGKIDVPLEGGPALVAAARRIGAIQSMRDQMEIWQAQKDLLGEVNPWLVAAGFDEVLKFRLGDETLVVVLLGHLDGPRPEFRRQALAVIEQIFEREVRTGTEIPSNDLLIRETLLRASGDEFPDIRARAVRTLRKARRSDLLATFQQLASSDPSQDVRYEAAVALKELEAAHR
jgi:hypothetical protein